MKLLFGKPGENPDLELHALLGNIDKNIAFTNIQPEIEEATKEVIKLIGKDAYEEIYNVYRQATIADDEAELIKSVRYPIALDGYRHFAISSDVVHGNNGRKIRVDEHNKVPFEWMIDRDNEAQERRYYKALDNMLDYLDEFSATWMASEEYKATQKYYVRKTSDFEDVYPIESRLLFLRLLPGFRRAEKKHIIPIITPAVNSDFKTRLQTGGLFNDDEKDLLELLKEASIYSALAWGMRVLRITLFPQGILQSFVTERMTTQGRKPSEKLETELAAQELEKRAREVLTELQTIVSPPTQTDIDSLCPTNPNFAFDDDDGFVSM
ncbi:hypothetical protein JJL45_05155 [Tamlana sp. s12]|uniref:DUF6712 family protein n=1 Tax=Tamlana sp. s12 TaxID=1630406 RepID=UPI0007FD4586|nr:DUF6712 family protein [Tamlana sp. s12]OBQ56108.1 hypothetical protein VQ01_06905 [Tamlana sp. s12]QQY83379.1 hypothetical protein JJL45_05155 [Tamlana sp. s12]